MFWFETLGQRYFMCPKLILILPSSGYSCLTDYATQLKYVSSNSIIFIHGLFGHPKNTWTAKNTTRSNDIFWPHHLLPEVTPYARIITWGYDVRVESLLSATSRATLFQHAETLLVDIASVRQSAIETKRPIIFVAHSLGGIVIKDALSQSKQEHTHLKEILGATIGIAFLGTPHRGSQAASLGKIAFEISRVLMQNPNLRILRALEDKSEILERISKSFSQLLNDSISIHSFHEELETKGVSIVDASSSTLGYSQETRSSLHANHRNMTKFTSAKDINFQRVSSALRRWAERCESVVAPMSQDIFKLGNLGLDDPYCDTSDKAYKNILKLLNNPEARSRLQEIDPTFTDTYAWVFDEKLGYRAWLQGWNTSPVYWISGKPGSGKSTLMKYTLTHEATPRYLHENNQDAWLLTGYFFHDRGTTMQKSMKGFLCELLYQIMKRRRDYLALVQPILRDLGPEGMMNDSANGDDIRTLRRALTAISSGPDNSLNCCLFVDALDEHDGDHRELISVLKELAQSPWNTERRFRLCLAGRPENIFEAALGHHPGFAIQDHTHADIRRYIGGRIQDAESAVTDQSNGIIRRISEKIEQKANGVFLWVRLVMDEIVEGLCEGDTLDELEALLSEIPTELSALYTRAIRRIPRRSGTAIQKHRAEAYIMFRMASSALLPIPLQEFIKATMFLASGVSQIGKHNRTSRKHMQRRLRGRSGGLLEERSPESGNGVGRVQFIHQTVKEYVATEAGAAAIKGNDCPTADENGVLLIFRYMLERLMYDSQLTLTERDKESSHWARLQFADYATELENFGKPAATWIESRISIFKDDKLPTILLETHKGYPDRTLNFQGEKPYVTWLIVYVIFGLHISLQRTLSNHMYLLSPESSFVILKAALDNNQFRCFEVLLRTSNSQPCLQFTADSWSETNELFEKRRPSVTWEDWSDHTDLLHRLRPVEVCE